MQVTQTWDGVRGVITIRATTEETQSLARKFARFPRLNGLVQRILMSVLHTMETEVTDLVQNYGFNPGGAIQLDVSSHAPAIHLSSVFPPEAVGYTIRAAADIAVFADDTVLQCVLTVTGVSEEFRSRANFIQLYIRPDLSKLLLQMLQKIFMRLDEIVLVSRFAFTRGTENGRGALVADILMMRSVASLRSRLYAIADASGSPRYDGMDARVITQILINGLVNPEVPL